MVSKANCHLEQTRATVNSSAANKDSQVIASSRDWPQDTSSQAKAQRRRIELRMEDSSLVVVNKKRLAKGARLSCLQVRVVRQLLIGALLAAVGLSCLLAMAQLPYESIVEESDAPELGGSAIQTNIIEELDVFSSTARPGFGHHKETGSSQTGRPNSTEFINLDKHDYSNGLTCSSNKYDRIIAYKLSRNELSRPVITSRGRFDNPFPTWKPVTSVDNFVQFVLEPDESSVPKDRDELEKALPIVRPQFVSPDTRNFRVTWFGHSSMLIQIDGLNILTDPVFSNYLGPVQYAGYKRIRRPPCDIQDLPQIDVVLISHNHFDHLDANSVKAINARFGESTRWIVPLALGTFLKTSGIKNYVELDWWQKDCLHLGPSAYEANGAELDIYLTPAQHWSRRAVNDMNKSLWGSYTLVSSSGSTFFFTGDTGYCTVFKEISEVFGPFTGAAIPIGAYKPRWFLRPQHVDPEEAVQVHRDLRSRKSIAIHHSTFVLSKEYFLEPKEWLDSVMIKMTDQEESGPFRTLNHGESTEFLDYF